MPTNNSQASSNPLTLLFYSAQSDKTSLKPLTHLILTRYPNLQLHLLPHSPQIIKHLIQIPAFKSSTELTPHLHHTILFPLMAAERPSNFSLMKSHQKSRTQICSAAFLFGPPLALRLLIVYNLARPSLGKIVPFQRSYKNSR
jgi:hypothetical protein